jgi:hypothetical protein
MIPFLRRYLFQVPVGGGDVYILFSCRVENLIVQLSIAIYASLVVIIPLLMGFIVCICLVGRRENAFILVLATIKLKFWCVHHSLFIGLLEVHC